jgi:integrase/recombinase XerD
MRAFEILSLRRKDFKKIKDYKELPVIGKGGDESLVFFSDRAIFWLEKYLEQRKDLSWPMFINSIGDPLRYGTAKSWLDRFKVNNPNLSGIEKLKCHTLRRTLGSCLSENNADLKSIQNVLRHKSERTTLRCYIRKNKMRAKEVHSEIINNLS